MESEEELIKHFASTEIDAFFEVNNILLEESHAQKDNLLEFMKNVSDFEIENILANKKYRALGKQIESLTWEENARIIYCKKVLPKEVGRLRINTLLDENTNPPIPYNHSALIDIERDSNDLISMSQMRDKIKNNQLSGYIFQILPSLPQHNSMYWTMISLFEVSNSYNVRLRLDPYLIFHKDSYSQMFYRMLVYGKPPKLDKLNTLKSISHLRWMPDDIENSEALFTDALWYPRDNQVHFVCEEIPKTDSYWYRGSRYFHAIYDCSMNKIIHLDGAIRIYSESEIIDRINCHVKDIGKIGKRVKIFQINGELSTNIWSKITASFFVWNEDVQYYFCN